MRDLPGFVRIKNRSLINAGAEATKHALYTLINGGQLTAIVGTAGPLVVLGGSGVCPWTAVGPPPLSAIPSAPTARVRASSRLASKSP